MATRDTLTPKEAQCKSGADYAALALEALQEPADAAYAKELMDRVAEDCQFTRDLAACAIAYKALGEQARTEELLGTAEDYCMSGEEQVALAEGIADALNDKAWASEAYSQLAGQIPAELNGRFAQSRQSRADLNFYGSVRRH